VRGPWRGLSLLLGVCACSSSSSELVLPYPVGQAMVFGAPEGGVTTPVDAACATETCLAVLERCGGNAYAEVVLGTPGNVLDVMCYPGDLRVREIGAAPFEAIGEESDTVFVFDALEDGADVLGDVTVIGENDVLYGAGAEVSILGGDLGIDGERTVLRGLTIRGDVTIDKNDAKLSLVQINGDLTINGNGVTLSESVVHGEVLVVGSNTVLSRNLLEGVQSLEGTNLACNLNQRFDDADGNRVIDDSELGSEVDCQ
jgi:hypothetical protein